MDTCTAILIIWFINFLCILRSCGKFNYLLSNNQWVERRGSRLMLDVFNWICRLLSMMLSQFCKIQKLIYLVIIIPNILSIAKFQLVLDFRRIMLLFCAVDIYYSPTLPLCGTKERTTSIHHMPVTSFHTPWKHLVFWYSQVVQRETSGIKSEAGVRMCSVKKVFLEISHNSQENTCARVSLLTRLQAAGL